MRGMYIISQVVRTHITEYWKNLSKTNYHAKDEGFYPLTEHFLNPWGPSSTAGQGTSVYCRFLNPPENNCSLSKVTTPL